MQTKEEILQSIRALAEQKIVTRSELTAAYDAGSGAGGDILTRKAGIAEVLYYIGGAIVFFGIVILLWQNWTDLSFFTKILVTLGSGVAAYIVAILLSRDEKTEQVGTAFYLISALVSPIGFAVLFDHAGLDTSSASVQSIIAAAMFLWYGLSLLFSKKDVVVAFTIAFGTWLFFAFTNFLVGPNPYFDYQNFYEYRVLAVGVTYMLLANSFSKSARAALTDSLYGLGGFAFLATTLFLGGWTPNQNAFWEVIYPGLTLGALFFSVQIKNKTLLTWGTIFLMIYIFKITAEYFSDSLGWPLALVLSGLAMIGIGYASVSLKQKYFAS